MAQYDIDLRDYWRIIQKRRPVILLSAAAILVFSFFFAELKKRGETDYFSSSATIRIDKILSAEETIMQLYGFSGTDDIATEVKTITSFPVMAEVSARMGALPDSLADLPETERDDLIQGDPELLSMINTVTSLIVPERFDYTNVINVNTVAEDPVTARDLARHTVEAYKEHRRISVNQRILNTITFIQSKIDEIERQVDLTQREIQDYSSRNSTVIPYHSGGALSNDILEIYRKYSDADIRENATNLMLDLLQNGDVIDDSVLSNAFAEEEGGIFIEKYLELIRLGNQRDELLQYFTPEHPDIRNLDAKILAAKELLVNQLKSNLKALQVQKQSYDITLNTLNTRYQNVVAKNDSLQLLIDRKDVLQEQYYEYMRQLQLVQIKESENIDEVTIIKPAVINNIPINSTTSVATISFIGLFLGVMIGTVSAFIFEALDTSIGTIEDVETYLGVSVIGHVPQIQKEDLKETVRNSDWVKNQEESSDNNFINLVIHYAPRSSLAESYRSLRTNIQFICHEKSASVLLFTSSSPREGKTTSIVNLAVTMAQSGNRVLLVDADLRKPQVAHIFGLDKNRGLSDILLGRRTWRECRNTVTDIIIGELGMNDIILTPGIDNLHIITCGPIPPNPSELLSSDNMDAFIASVRDEYDIVLFDSPPTLPATDAAVLGRKVDGVVFVYAVGKIARGSLKRAKALMDNVKAAVVGVVLNGMRSDLSADFHDMKYDEYYYAYHDTGFNSQSSRLNSLKRRVADLIGRR